MITDKFWPKARSLITAGGHDKPMHTDKPRLEEISASHWDHHASAGIRPQWTQHPLVEQALYQRISGVSAKFWLNWLCDDYFQREFPRVLSLGCGDGSHELMLGGHPKIGHIDAFDLSPASIQIARANAAKMGLRESVTFFQASFDDFDTYLDARPYDLICFFGSLHHVREIEAVLAKVARLLAPQGRLVFNEYTGDCYTILDERKVKAINGLLSCLDPLFLNPARPLYRNPTLDEMLSGDPSEGVRASLILPFLRHRFQFELLRPFGGAVLHLLYPCLNHERLVDGSPESNSIIRLLIEADRLLYEDTGYLPSDFYVGVCRLG